MISPKKPKILSISAKENRPDGQPRGTWFGKAEACFTARRNGSGSRDSPEMADEGSSGGGRNTDPLEGVRPIVLKLSESLDESRFIAGACFNDTGLGLDGLLGSLASTGFQASYLGVVNQMLDWRLSHEKPTEDCDEAELDPKYRESVKCKIFLGFTSNLVSSGLWHTGCNQVSSSTSHGGCYLL